MRYGSVIALDSNNRSGSNNNNNNNNSSNKSTTIAVGRSIVVVAATTPSTFASSSSPSASSSSSSSSRSSTLSATKGWTFADGSAIGGDSGGDGEPESSSSSSSKKERSIPPLLKILKPLSLVPKRVSDRLFTDATILKQGFLEKKTTNSKTLDHWRWRYFVISEEPDTGWTFSYFRQKRKGSDQRRKEKKAVKIPLGDHADDNNNNNSFSISFDVKQTNMGVSFQVNTSSKSLILRAENPEEALAWAVALEKARDFSFVNSIGILGSSGAGKTTIYLQLLDYVSMLLDKNDLINKNRYKANIHRGIWEDIKALLRHNKEHKIVKNNENTLQAIQRLEAVIQAHEASSSSSSSSAPPPPPPAAAAAAASGAASSSCSRSSTSSSSPARYSSSSSTTTSSSSMRTSRGSPIVILPFIDLSEIAAANPTFCDDVMDLVYDSDMQRALGSGSGLPFLSQNFKYFFEESNFLRITAPDYNNDNVTMDDCLHAFLQEGDGIEFNFKLPSGKKFEITDTKAHRDGRKRWATVASRCRVLLYVISLAEFDEISKVFFAAENHNNNNNNNSNSGNATSSRSSAGSVGGGGGGSSADARDTLAVLQNKMAASLHTFEKLMKLEVVHKNAGMVPYLVFTKCDVLAEKAKHSSMKDFFPEYNGRIHDYEDYLQFIIDKYVDSYAQSTAPGLSSGSSSKGKRPTSFIDNLTTNPSSSSSNRSSSSSSSSSDPMVVFRRNNVIVCNACDSEQTHPAFQIIFGHCMQPKYSFYRGNIK